MKNRIRIIGLVCGVGVFAFAGFMYFQSQAAARKTASIQAQVNVLAQENAPKEDIWIGNDGCKTSFGPNTIAFCDGLSLDNSLFFDSGADAAVKACFEYVADKLSRPQSEARDIACEIKEAYEDRNFEHDSDTDTFGIQNNNYNILNEWVNR
jgi:hypothetical protein